MKANNPDQFKGPGPGRPKGSQNKFNVSVKDAFKKAFDDMGGPNALLEWGRSNPTDFYKLASKLIPTELQADVQGALEIIITDPTKKD